MKIGTRLYENVTRDKKPWFVAEVKNANEKLSPALSLFQRQTGAEYAFQIVAERPLCCTKAFCAGSECSPGLSCCSPLSRSALL